MMMKKTTQTKALRAKNSKSSLIWWPFQNPQRNPSSYDDEEDGTDESEELKKLPDSEFCNAVAFTWACELTGPKPFWNTERNPPSYDYGTDESASREELKKLPDAVASDWACQLTGPKDFQNPERNPSSYDDKEDDTKESTAYVECSLLTQQDKKKDNQALLKHFK